jgi:hypothetical protein
MAVLKALSLSVYRGCFSVQPGDLSFTRGSLFA